MPKGVYQHKLHSEQWKQRMSKRMKGNKYRLGIKHTEEIKQKISNSLKGQKRSDEFKEGARERMKISPMRYYWKGKKRSEETKRRMSEGMRKPRPNFQKEKSHMWKGGLSFEPYSTDWTETLRRSIRERDNYICQLCSKTQIEELEEFERKLQVHHIDYNKKNCNPNNLITLCLICNLKVNYDRDYWLNYFKNL